MTQKYSITTQQLSKHFGMFKAVDSISFNVKKGEIFGFLGANGAGKTTAMRMLCGLSIPTSGSATVAGFDIYKNSEKVKENIGYMSQKFSLYNDLTVQENIEFYGGVYGMKSKDIRRKKEELLKRLNMSEKANSITAALPLGWKQKLAFSIAIMHDPDIVFLDEPTGGVDPLTRRQFWEMIYEASYQGITVFVTTHYMDESEYCDRVAIMVDGVIAAMNSPEQLKIDYKTDDMDEVFYQLARKAKRQ
jgi:ABC-2 type transport system ATP-binding protein